MAASLVKILSVLVAVSGCVAVVQAGALTVAQVVSVFHVFYNFLKPILNTNLLARLLFIVAELIIGLGAYFIPPIIDY